MKGAKMPYIDKDKLTKELSTMYKSPTSAEDFMAVGYDHAIADVVVTAYGQPTADVVARSAYDQVRWERDTAIAQLAEIGKGFGETMDDVVERKRGIWVNRSLNIVYPEWERYTCSVCGKHAYAYDFCPNCGADMRERSEDE